MLDARLMFDFLASIKVWCARPRAGQVVGGGVQGGHLWQTAHNRPLSQVGPFNVLIIYLPFS